MIAPEDTFTLHRGRFAHLDCKRPRTLSPEERVLLFRYCWDHAAAECQGCAKGYRITELASDLFSGRELLCPRCRSNLIASVRTHFFNCSLIPTAIRQRAREVQEVARRLVEQGPKLAERADILMRELEVALRTLRETAILEPPLSRN